MINATKYFVYIYIFNNNNLTWLNTAPDHPEDVVRLLPSIFGGDSYSNFPENSAGDYCKIFFH